MYCVCTCTVCIHVLHVYTCTVCVHYCVCTCVCALYALCVCVHTTTCFWEDFLVYTAPNIHVHIHVHVHVHTQLMFSSAPGLIVHACTVVCVLGYNGVVRSSCIIHPHV